MTANLARKPRLTLIVGNGRPVPDIGVIAPEVDDEPVAVGSRKDTWRWLTSLLIVLVVYGAPFAWWLVPENNPGTNAPPPAAMVVELAPIPVAPASEPDMPPGPEQVEATPPPQPEPQSEPESEIPPAPPEVKPEVAVKPKPEPTPEEQPEPKEPPPPDAPEELPPEDQPSSTASAPPDAAQQDIDAASPEQGVSVPSFNATAIPSWQNSLMLKLNEAKRYPTRARRYRQEGAAYLRFTMDREGNILAKSIEQSAGHPLLDEETLELIDRAQPLPEPPTEMQGEKLEFVVPVEFFLNR